eukprot:TRINITY_DN6624_c1_g1_i1.p1 TRINITY_DN6624_c1_g1~~TRINITY_DN6624_c1_g1_i1.p1  ORF type:complete len:415 (+),score=131.59 TRINITY_DN6624_c1_g1_i1:66-1310(+)
MTAEVKCPVCGEQVQSPKGSFTGSFGHRCSAAGAAAASTPPAAEGTPEEEAAVPFECPAYVKGLPLQLVCEELEEEEGEEEEEVIVDKKGPKALWSFKQHGETWQAGVRVTTRCALAGADKTEHPEGSAGCVWEVLDEGLMVVCLDNADCGVQTVRAEAGDLIHEGRVPMKTRVRCRPVLLTQGEKTKNIPRGSTGETRAFNEATNKYTVKFDELKIIADVPAAVVQPFSPKKTLKDRILSWTPKAFNARIARQERAAGFARATQSASPISQRAKASSFIHPPRTPCSPLASPAPQRYNSVLHLSKIPSYSNVSGSPRARNARAGSFSNVSFEVEHADSSQTILTPDSSAVDDPSASFTSARSEEGDVFVPQPLAKKRLRNKSGKGIVAFAAGSCGITPATSTDLSHIEPVMQE